MKLKDYRLFFAAQEDHWAFRVGFGLLEAAFGAWGYARLSRRAHRELMPGETIWGTYLRLCRVAARATGPGLALVPREGPVVFVANHPTGIPDAAVLGHLIDCHIRPDALFIAVRAFSELPCLAGRIIPIDLTSPSGKTRTNRVRQLPRSILRARRHLETGGALVAFPCGPIAERTADGGFADGTWQKAIFKLAIDAGADVVPIYLDAPMSRLRQALLAWSRILYYAAAAHEVRAIKGRHVAATFGEPVAPAVLAEHDRTGDVAAAMRETTYRLADDTGPSVKPASSSADSIAPGSQARRDSARRGPLPGPGRRWRRDGPLARGRRRRSPGGSETKTSGSELGSNRRP